MFLKSGDPKFRVLFCIIQKFSLTNKFNVYHRPNVFI